MAKYRIAVLTGNSPRLSERSVQHYQTISARSYPAAVATATRMNAIVIGWRVAV